MGNIIGQPLDGYVIDQINARQALHGSGVRFNENERNPDQINILNSNTAWIKLASGVSIDPDGPGMQKLKDLGFTESERSNLSGIGLAKKYVLHAGISQYNNGTLSQREGFNPPSFGNDSIARDAEDSSYIYSRNLNSQGLHTADAGYAPMPGIISAEIKALNRGSLEKAFIKIKAQNRQQLDILDILYMRLGYTVLLEWGNSLYTDDGVNKKIVRNTIIEDKFFKLEGKRSYLDFIGGTTNPLIKSYKRKYSGNYDGMLAIISNFSWTFNPDGSYDIDLTLISLGDVIESLKTNLSISQGLTKYIATYNVPEDAEEGNESGDLIETNKKSNIISSMLWLFKRFGPTSRKLTISHENTNTVDVGNFLANGDSTLTTYTKIYNFRRRDVYDPSTGEYSWIEQTKTFSGEDPDNEADQFLISQYLLVFPEANGFVSTDDIQRSGKKSYLGPKDWVAEYIIKDSSKNIVSNPIDNAPFNTAFVFNTKTPQYYLRFQYLLEYIQERVIPTITSDNGDVPLFNIDIGLWSNKMYSLPNQISVDPKVCLVRNNNFLKKSGKYDKVLSELPYFRVADKGASENPNYAYLMNIYLNFEFIINSLDSNINDRGDVNIYGFISTICTGLNKALGGVNNLEPVLDKDEVTLKIIDSTPIPGVTAPDSGDYQLMLYGYKGSKYRSNLQSFSEYDSNFVRNIDLKTTITPEYATMVTVGATANGYVKGTEATAFSIWNRGLTDRFKQELISPDPDYVASTNPNEAVFNYSEQFITKTAQCYGLNTTHTPFLDGELGDFDKEIISKNISVVTEYYKYLVAEKGKTTQQAGTVGFIPFKLGITMTLDFIITGVNHKLQNNDWETTLDTIVIPKTSEIKSLDINFTAISNTINNNTPFTTPHNPTIFTTGTGIYPIKNLIALYESQGGSSSNTAVAGSYLIYNYGPNGSSIRSAAPDNKKYSPKAINLTTTKISTLTKPYKGTGTQNLNIFAMGRYQTIPTTLKSIANAKGISNQNYTKANQEIVVDYLLLESSYDSVKNYLNGTNGGSMSELAKAVNDIAKIWAAMPTVWLSNGTQVGTVQYGGGNTSYYGNVGINRSSVTIHVADVVQALIKSRIQYSGKTPSFIPTYYIP